MSVEMIAKFGKYWKEIQGPMGLATILDPRFKTDYLLGFIETPSGESSEDSVQGVSDVTNTLYDLMKEYEMDDDEDNTESSTPALANSGVLSTIRARVASRRPAAVKFKSELDRYLEDELVPIQTENFHILNWWKVARTRYPILRKVARDIYAIPVSTVASESAFSTSGRVFSEHRSHLTPNILEALMCSQDWLRNKYRGVQVVPIIDYIDRFSYYHSCMIIVIVFYR
jgi:hypothetical protein